MIKQEKVLVIDIDGTLCSEPQQPGYYETTVPYYPIIDKLRELKATGHYIILHSSRQMRTYNGNLGLINANTLPVLHEWLKKYDVPYDEIHLGKPWCSQTGYYVDDKAIRPSEFLQLSLEQINALLEREKDFITDLMAPISNLGKKEKEENSAQQVDISCK